MPVINSARPSAITPMGPVLIFFKENKSDKLDFRAEHSSQTKARMSAAYTEYTFILYSLQLVFITIEKKSNERKTNNSYIKSKHNFTNA